MSFEENKCSVMECDWEWFGGRFVVDQATFLPTSILCQDPKLFITTEKNIVRSTTKIEITDCSSINYSFQDIALNLKTIGFCPIDDIIIFIYKDCYYNHCRVIRLKPKFQCNFEHFDSSILTDKINVSYNDDVKFNVPHPNRQLVRSQIKQTLLFELIHYLPSVVIEFEIYPFIVIEK